LGDEGGPLTRGSSNHAQPLDGVHHPRTVLPIRALASRP
jgi:hypothetical protein